MVGSRVDISIERIGVADHVLPGIDLAVEQLSPEDIEFLKNLPLITTRNGCTFVHASADEPHEFQYLLYDKHYLPHFKRLETPICFTGHSHYPALAIHDGDYVRFRCFADASVFVNGVDKASFDVGSVGQPRDHDPRASYGIFDTATLSYLPRRVPYDIVAAQNRMAAAKQPRKNSERLATGQ